MDWFVAVLLAKLIGIPGLGGLVSGMFIRSLPVAFMGGAVAGILGPLVLASTRATGVEPSSWFMAVLAGLIAALIGWLIRGRKLTR
jgi:hypothetical protein